MRRIMQTLRSIFPALNKTQDTVPALVSKAADSFVTDARSMNSPGAAPPASCAPLQPSQAKRGPCVGQGPLIIPLNTADDYSDFSTPAGQVMNKLARCQTIAQQVAVLKARANAAGLAALRDYSMHNVTDATTINMVTICSLLARRCPAMEAVFFMNAELSPEAVGHLQALSNLHGISVRNCILAQGALDALEGCTQIESFELEAAAEPADLPAVLARMPGLQALNLHLPAIGGEMVSAIRSMTALQALFLDATTASALPELHDLPAAQKLGGVALGNVAKGYDMSWLGQCVNLQALSLHGEGVNDQALATLAGKLPNLEMLQVSGCSLSDSGAQTIATFKALRELHCASWPSRPCGFTDAGFAALATLPNLENLDADGAAIGDDGAEALLRAPKLSEFRIDAKHLSAAVRQRVLQHTGDLWTLKYMRNTDAGKRAIAEDQVFCEAHGLLPTEGITHLPMRSRG